MFPPILPTILYRVFFSFLLRDDTFCTTRTTSISKHTQPAQAVGLAPRDARMVSCKPSGCLGWIMLKLLPVAVVGAVLVFCISREQHPRFNISRTTSNLIVLERNRQVNGQRPQDTDCSASAPAQAARFLFDFFESRARDTLQRLQPQLFSSSASPKGLRCPALCSLQHGGSVQCATPKELSSQHTCWMDEHEGGNWTAIFSSWFTHAVQKHGRQGQRQPASWFVELSDGLPSTSEWYEGLNRPLLSPALGWEDSTGLMFPNRYAILGYLGMPETRHLVPPHLEHRAKGDPICMHASRSAHSPLERMLLHAASSQH